MSGFHCRERNKVVNERCYAGQGCICKPAVCALCDDTKAIEDGNATLMPCPACCAPSPSPAPRCTTE